LVELNGQPVKNPSPNQKETHLIFKKEGNRVQGNGGCNTLMGTYELLEGNRLHFSGVASTMMACMDMQTEDELKRVIEMTDHFAINGRVLFLQKAKMAPLAKFEAR
jgi:heat shock protein HslJ